MEYPQFYIHMLAGGLEHVLFFPYIGKINPNWLTHIFRGVDTNRSWTTFWDAHPPGPTIFSYIFTLHMMRLRNCWLPGHPDQRKPPRSYQVGYFYIITHYIDHIISLWFSISIISIEIAWLFFHVFSRSSCILLLWHNYHLVNIQKTMENHNFQWVNPRIQWPFSSSQTVTNYQRVYH
jgi:hypothetical protein